MRISIKVNLCFSLFLNYTRDVNLTNLFFVSVVFRDVLYSFTYVNNFKNSIYLFL